MSLSESGKEMRRLPRTYVQCVASKVESLYPSDRGEILPSMHKCLDVKSQSWAHAHNVFVVEFFQYGGLPGIIKTPASDFIWTHRFLVDVDYLQKQQSHLLLLLPVLPYYSEQPHKRK
jgi:hypothetical protein